MAKFTKANADDLRTVLQKWQDKISDGSFHLPAFKAFIQGIMKTFSSDEYKVREVIKEFPKLVSELGGGIPSYARFKPKRTGCCG